MHLAIGKICGALLALITAALVYLSIGDTPDSAPLPEGQRPIQVLILTGENNHDWPATSKYLKNVLESYGDIVVEVYDEPQHLILATPEINKYDVLLLNFNKQRRWRPDVEAGFTRFLDAGKGVVVLHAANNSFASWPEYERILGAAWRTGTFHPPYGRFLVQAKDPSHPIMAGISRFETTDELYSNLRDYPAEMNLLAYAEAPGSRSGGKLEIQPVIWTTNRQNGRLFHMTLGHDVAAMKNGYFIEILQRGTAWAAGRL